MLQIRSLSKTYANGVHALNGVTLDIPRGMFGLLGPNGAGKSSLMRTLSTLQEADSGSVTLEIPGEPVIDVLRDKDAVRRRLGYLPQDFGVYPKVSALDLLDHFAVLKGITHKAPRREVVDGLLQQVNLWDARKRKLGTYSGGMRQRFGIAQALLGDPRLVIVDEPTAGLDPIGAAAFDRLIKTLQEALGLTVLLITHDLDTLYAICDRVAVLADQKVIANAPLHEIEQLDHPWIQEYFHGPRARAARDAKHESE